jgi:hypothetical protein
MSAKPAITTAFFASINKTRNVNLMVSKYMLTYIRWRWIFVLGITMGLLNGASYRTVLLNPVIGIFLCGLVWFTNRPLVWWYDFFYFGVLLAFTYFAWLISVATCSVLQLAIGNYTHCEAVNDFYHLTGMAVFVIIPNVILYVATYTMSFVYWMRNNKQ